MYITSCCSLYLAKKILGGAYHFHIDTVVVVNFHQCWVFFADFSVNFNGILQAIFPSRPIPALTLNNEFIEERQMV